MTDINSRELIMTLNYKSHSSQNYFSPPREVTTSIPQPNSNLLSNNKRLDEDERCIQGSRRPGSSKACATYSQSGGMFFYLISCCSALVDGGGAGIIGSWCCLQCMMLPDVRGFDVLADSHALVMCLSYRYLRFHCKQSS